MNDSSSVKILFPRKKSGTSQSISHPAVHHPKDVPNDRKSLNFSGSSYGVRTLHYTPSKNVQSPQNRKNLSKISDFYDRKQINEAVHSVKSLNGRIKLLDSIVKRRVEIEEIEKQSRFERVAPILSKAGENLRKRVLAKSKENNVRRSFFLDSLNLPTNPDESYMSVATESDAASRSSRRPSTSMDDRKTSIFAEAPREGFHTDYGVHKPNDEFLPPILLTSPDSEKAESLFEGSATLKQPNTSALARTNGIKKTSKILSLLTKNLRKADRTPQALVFGNDEPKPANHETFHSIVMKISQKSSSKKRDTSRSKLGSLTKEVYSLGSKVLEKDLYRYLVKNEIKTEAKQVIMSTKEIEEPLMRDIELKAKSQFSNFLAQRHQTSYMLPNSLLAKTNKAERSKYMTGPCKCVSHQASAQRLKAKLNGHKCTKSSSFVRISHQDSAKEAYGLVDNTKEYAVTANDDSFASLTETKLDELYRDSHKLNKVLATLNGKMDTEVNTLRMKKWEESKQRKVDDLNHNSVEALKTISRKMKSKGF